MSDLLETVEDGVAVLTLNRPERRNALSREIVEALREAVPRLAGDPDVGAVVLTGAGGAFCAGGDVKGFAEGGGANKGVGSMEVAATRLRTNMEIARWLHDMPKPTIAAIPGSAAGAGLSLALACDFRIAARGAKLTTAFGKVGLSGDFGGSYFLTRLVGTARARELFMLCEVILAEEAEPLGIVNRVVEPEALAAEAMALARRLADGPRVALGYMKKNLNMAETGSLSDCFDLEAFHQSRSAMTEDHAEAARAFVEKRKPRFSGR